VTGRALNPFDRRCYPAKWGHKEQISEPHKAPGKPWGVKPHGYWTAWTPEQREAHDRAEVEKEQ
jgi:hypothetical protein